MPKQSSAENVSKDKVESDEVEAWKNMMDSMVIFIKASTSLMQTMNGKLNITNEDADILQKLVDKTTINDTVSPKIADQSIPEEKGNTSVSRENPDISVAQQNKGDASNACEKTENCLHALCKTCNAPKECAANKAVREKKMVEDRAESSKSTLPPISEVPVQMRTKIPRKLTPSKTGVNKSTSNTTPRVRKPNKPPPNRCVSPNNPSLYETKVLCGCNPPELSPVCHCGTDAAEQSRNESSQTPPPVDDCECHCDEAPDQTQDDEIACACDENPSEPEFEAEPEPEPETSCACDGEDGMSPEELRLQISQKRAELEKTKMELSVLESQERKTAGPQALYRQIMQDSNATNQSMSFADPRRRLSFNNSTMRSASPRGAPNRSMNETYKNFAPQFNSSALSGLGTFSSSGGAASRFFPQNATAASFRSLAGNTTASSVRSRSANASGGQTFRSLAGNTTASSGRRSLNGTGLSFKTLAGNTTASSGRQSPNATGLSFKSLAGNTTASSGGQYSYGSSVGETSVCPKFDPSLFDNSLGSFGAPNLTSTQYYGSPVSPINQTMNLSSPGRTPRPQFSGMDSGPQYVICTSGGDSTFNDVPENFDSTFSSTMVGEQDDECLCN